MVVAFPSATYASAAKTMKASARRATIKSNSPVTRTARLSSRLAQEVFDICGGSSVLLSFEGILEYFVTFASAIEVD